MKKYKKDIIISVILILIFVVYTLLVKRVDVKAIGPKSSRVGFATLNGLISNKIGVNMLFYKLTDIVGFIPFLIVLVYAIKGFFELIKRKSLFKVDKELILLGLFYVIIMLFYVFFELVVINYRPTLIDGVLEASYPSSHTMLTIFICISAIIVNKYLIRESKTRNILSLFSIIVMTLIVLGRVISGVHWFTDIVGGILISFALLKSFDTILKIIKEKHI